jgi:hypothetical protein
MDKFWVRLFGCADDARKYVLLKNLTEILLPVQENPSLRLSLGLRFPISQDVNCIAYDTSFWLEVSLRFLGNSHLSPVFFWTIPDSTNPSYLFLFFRQPSPKHYTKLIKVDFQSDNICELEEEGKENIESIIPSIPHHHRSLLEEQELTLDGFLHQL